jgi:TPR repeat protein
MIPRTVALIVAFLLAAMNLLALTPADVLRPAELAEVQKYYEVQFGADRRDEMLAEAMAGGYLREYVQRLSVYDDLKLLEAKEMQADWERLDDPNWSRLRASQERDQRKLRWELHPEKKDVELPALVRREREVFDAGISGRVRDFLLASAGSDFHSARVSAALLGDYFELMPSFRYGPCYAMYELGVRNDNLIRADRATALGLMARAVDRGGRCSAVLLASLKVEGKHVVKDEAGALAMLAPLAETGTSAAHAYAKALSADAATRRQALERFAGLARDGTFPYRESATYQALVLSRDFDHAEHLTWLYVAKALSRVRARHSPDWPTVPPKNISPGDQAKLKERQDFNFWTEAAQDSLNRYESRHGDSTGYMPWRKAHRFVAQERAGKIVAEIDKSVLWGSTSSSELGDLLGVAHEGDAAAQYDVGISYLQGSRGFPRDEVLARKWFARSAGHGFVPASYNYGLCLANGIGGAGDAAEAARLFLFGAMRGDALSQHNLGAAYGTGRGIGRDYVEAAAWWLLCEARVPEAKKNLSSLAANADPAFMAKAKARAEVIRNEITLQFFKLKKDLSWLW